MFLFVIKINILNIHTPKINVLIINNIVIKICEGRRIGSSLYFYGKLLAPQI